MAYGKMPLKNGKPDPIWLAIFLIFSTIMASHIIWIVARNGFSRCYRFYCLDNRGTER